MRLVIFYFLIACSCAACKKTAQEKPITDEEFRAIYADACLIYAQTDSSKRYAKIDSLLLTRKITMQDLQTMVDRYNEDPRVWVDFFKGVDQDLHTTANTQDDQKKKKIVLLQLNIHSNVFVELNRMLFCMSSTAVLLVLCNCSIFACPVYTASAREREIFSKRILVGRLPGFLF